MGKKVNINISHIALLICPILTFYLFDMYTGNPFTGMDFRIQLLNMFFYVTLGLLLLGLFKSVRIALMVETGAFMVIGLANYYVQNFRSAPIMPWDIYSIKTAGSVARNYSYALEAEAVFVLIGFCVLLFLESRLDYKAFNQKNKRITMVLATVLSLCLYTGLVQNENFHLEFGLYDKLFTPTVMNIRNGNVVAFLMELKYLDVEKPSGYSAGDMKEFYDALESSDVMYNAVVSNPKLVHRPNIIVIMDEAFSDLSVLGDFETNEDYMPFIHSLQNGAENTVSGYMNVSVLGGNTANTEFEFLTGNTMGFLPSGSVAYQQYLNNETPSLTSYMNELGYETAAVHPYNASGWERDRVYSLLGFDKFYSLKDFNTTKKIRDYISDATDFKKLQRIYEQKDENKPIFIFNVTMQNHSGYETIYDNFTPDIKINGINSKSLSTYLSLLKQTDAAFEKLVEYFKAQDEDTIIVFFGDHQPNAFVSNPIFELNGVDTDNIAEEQNLLRYKVPYVIWANYDIDESIGGETSANYLMTDLLKNAGLPLPPYQKFLSGLREEYPVISAIQVTDSEGNIRSMSECGGKLDTYKSMQYYLLFE